jgi:hypothetical protein
MAAAPHAANAEDAMQVERVGPGAGATPTRKGAESASSDGFAELLGPPAATVGPAAAHAPAATARIALIGLPSDDDRLRAVAMANRRARRHGRAMLRALRDLQAALLAGPQDSASAALADLAARMPETDDPALRLILGEIGARAAVELARHGAQANISIA